MVLLLSHQQKSNNNPTVLPNHNLKTKQRQEKFNSVYTIAGRTNPQGRGFLLCCVCNEQNTTYRYEVVFKANDKRLSVNNTDLNISYQNESSLLKITDDSGIQSVEDDHEYYNFPPRHPRHGHLKWSPVYWSILPLTYNKREVLKSNGNVKTYPDYPVHIPTTTLRRAADNIKRGRIGQKHFIRFLSNRVSFDLASLYTLQFKSYPTRHNISCML